MTKRWIVGMAALVVLLFQIVGHGQTADTQPDLSTQLRERYDIVSLQQGVALVPRDAASSVRMIQVVNGVVTVDGETLTGRQLQDRLGSDADLVLQVSYLTLQQQRGLAGTAPGASTAGGPGTQPTETVERSEVTRGDRVRFGGDITVGRNERLEGDAVSIGGSVTVDGEVTGDAVSIGGTLTLGPDAVVRGDAVSVGGTLNRAQGARVDGEITEVGRGGPMMGGGRWFPGMFGTFWSRLGSLAGTLLRIGLLVLLAVMLVAFGRSPVERIAARISTTPVRSGLIGLLAEILFLPVLILVIVVLAVSIVGIPLLALVPFAVVLLMLVMLIGFVGLAYQIGKRLTNRFAWTERGDYAAVAIGVVAIGALTVIAKLAALAGGFLIGAPLTAAGYLVEYVAWTVGFGAAILYWSETQPRFGGPRTATPTPAVSD
ncbi:MAG: polymer-forming cytoskeletal protein [Vicinamibacterales bacterium]